MKTSTRKHWQRLIAQVALGKDRAKAHKKPKRRKRA